MKTRRRVVAVLVALAALVGAVLYWLSSNGPPLPELSDEPGPTRQPGSEPVTVAPAPRFTVEEAPVEEPSPPPSSGAESGDDPPRDPGFCPPPGEDLEPFPRPGLASLLNERTDELVARARLAARGSETLREGLSQLNIPGQGALAVTTLASAPDRIADGFDFASAAAVAASARALADNGDVDIIVEAARRFASDDPIVHVLAAHVAAHRRDELALREALEAAYRLDPNEPAVALALGRSLANSNDEGRAFAALRTYLRDYGDDVEIARLARRLELRRDLAADYGLVERGGLSLRHHPSISADAARATLDLAEGVLGEAARLLGVTRRPELAIVVYGSPEELRAVTCVPGWAGGVYDGTLRLTRSTVTDPRERDRIVRHEGLHAALGAAAGPTPYWFNEGLAQRFANERGPAQRESWARIARSGMVIPFPSLEGSFLDIDDASDAGLAYHQSLAMVDLLAERRGERVFADAVSYLSGGGDPEALWTTLAGARPVGREDLVEFLRAE